MSVYIEITSYVGLQTSGDEVNDFVGITVR